VCSPEIALAGYDAAWNSTESHGKALGIGCFSLSHEELL